MIGDVTPQLTYRDLRSWAPWPVLVEGASLWQVAEVIELRDGTVNAWVRTAPPHFVEVREGIERIGRCSCGVQGRRPCAHAVAACFSAAYAEGGVDAEGIETMARFSASMADLETAEREVAARYAETVDGQGSTLADFLENLGKRRLDRELVGALTGPTDDDARRLREFLDALLAYRTDSAGPHEIAEEIEKLVWILRSEEVRRDVTAPFLLGLLPLVRSVLARPTWGPSWRTLQVLGRVAAGDVRQGFLSAEQVAVAVLDAEIGEEGMVEGIPVLGWVVPWLGKDICVALGEEFDVRDVGGRRLDGRRRVEVALGSRQIERLVAALERWPDAPLGEISGRVRLRELGERAVVVDAALSRDRVRWGDWRRPKAWTDDLTDRDLTDAAAAMGILTAGAEVDAESEERDAVPVKEAVGVLVDLGRVDEAREVVREFAARGDVGAHVGEMGRLVERVR